MGDADIGLLRRRSCNYSDLVIQSWIPRLLLIVGYVSLRKRGWDGSGNVINVNSLLLQSFGYSVE